MRWTPFIAIGLTGCSILYNPNNIPEGGKDASQIDSPGDSPKRDAPMIDAPVDMMLDAPPGAFALQDLYPTQMIEGQGVGGSRRVPLLIRGQNISPTATVTLSATSGPAIDVIVHDADKVVNAARNTLVVPITINVAPTRSFGMRSDVTVTVSQMGMTGMESQALTSLRITYLDEMTSATHPAGTIAPGTYRFSRVDITSLTTTTSNTTPLLIRSTSSIRITGLAHVNATGSTPGTGGNGGGAGGQPVNGDGEMGMGPGGGKPSGGGGGFATTGEDGASAMTGGAATGDPGLSNHDTNRSSGGAGGDAGLSSGGAGGGGGGTIELSADGTITLNDVEARGGNGASGNNTGGGGSGGSILLRSGGTAMIGGTVVISGGTGDGAGSIGRFRLDAPAASVTVDSPQGPPYRGPQLATTTPLVTTAKRPMITVFGGSLKPFQYYFSNEDGSMLRGPVSSAIGVSGQNTFPLAEDLFLGGNTLCLLVEGANLGLQRPEARNCVLIIYAP